MCWIFCIGLWHSSWSILLLEVGHCNTTIARKSSKNHFTFSSLRWLLLRLWFWSCYFRRFHFGLPRFLDYKSHITRKAKKNRWSKKHRFFVGKMRTLLVRVKKVHLNRQPTTDNRQPTTDKADKPEQTDNDNRQNRQRTTDNRQTEQPTTSPLSFRLLNLLFLRGNPWYLRSALSLVLFAKLK